jgi:hypothetical protein
MVLDHRNRACEGANVPGAQLLDPNSEIGLEVAMQAISVKQQRAN